MRETIPAKAPAGFVPEAAIAFADTDGSAILVDAAHPLPVVPAQSGATASPLSGSASASLVAGPFAAQPGFAIWLTLSGSWTGTITVKRSIDGGATLLPLTIAGQAWARFTANVQEPICEDRTGGAGYYLDIALTSGTVSYRVQQ